MWVMIIEWLNDNAGAVQGMATVALLIVTGWYAILTRNIAREARRSQRAYVYADVTTSGRSFGMEFVIGNTGSRAAHNVMVTVAANHDEVVEALAGLGCVTHGMSYIAPGQRYRYYVRGGINEWLEMKPPPRIDVFVAYSDAEHNHEESFTFDIAAFESAAADTFRTPEQDMAAELREIGRTMRSKESSDRMAQRTRQWFSGSCPVCKSEIHPDARRCPRCGARLALREHLKNARLVLLSTVSSGGAKDESN